MDFEGCCSCRRCCSCSRFRISTPPDPHRKPSVIPPQKLTSLHRARWVFLCFSLLLLLAGTGLRAQVSDAGNRQLLHGQILTEQGRPAPEIKVEIRDLRGIKVGSSITDSLGKFEIRGAAEPGEYVFVAVNAFQVSDLHVQLDQTNPQTSLTVRSAPGQATPYAVSVGRLGVPKKAWAHLAAADREFKRMNFEKASQEVADAIQLDPACARAFSMRAFIKLAENDPHGAAQDAERAAFLDSDDSESFIALAMSYNALKEFHKAETAAEHALTLRPESWQGRLELAKSYYGERKYIRTLCELDAVNIDFPDAHLIRGNALISLGRPQDAKEEFDTFLRQVPNDRRDEQIRHIEAMGSSVNDGASTSNR